MTLPPCDGPPVARIRTARAPERAAASFWAAHTHTHTSISFAPSAQEEPGKSWSSPWCGTSRCSWSKRTSVSALPSLAHRPWWLAQGVGPRDPWCNRRSVGRDRHLGVCKPAKIHRGLPTYRATNTMVCWTRTTRMHIFLGLRASCAACGSRFGAGEASQLAPAISPPSALPLGGWRRSTDPPEVAVQRARGGG